MLVISIGLHQFQGIAENDRIGKSVYLSRQIVDDTYRGNIVSNVESPQLYQAIDYSDFYCKQSKSIKYQYKTLGSPHADCCSSDSESQIQNIGGTALGRTKAPTNDHLGLSIDSQLNKFRFWCCGFLPKWAGLLSL